MSKESHKYREERARSLIQFGTGLCQAMYGALFLVPIAAIFKASGEPEGVAVNPLSILDEMGNVNIGILIGLWGFGVIFGIYVWRRGLRLIDELDREKKRRLEFGIFFRT